MAINSVVTKLANDALNKAVTKSNAELSPLKQGASFKDYLGNMDSGQAFAKQLGIGQDMLSRTTDTKVLGGESINFDASQETFGIGEPNTSQKLVDLLGEVNKGQIQMDSLVNNILYSERKFSNQELLCIQAHVFHFAQMTELTVKIAEQGVTSIKGVLNTQVQ